MEPNPHARRVVILNENAVFRTAATLFVNMLHGYAVAGASDLGPEAQNVVAETRPDVVLLGHSIPMAHSIALAWRVKQISPETAMVLMPLFSSAAPYLQALRDEIDAAVAKDQFTEELPLVLERLFS